MKITKIHDITLDMESHIMTATQVNDNEPILLLHSGEVIHKIMRVLSRKKMGLQIYKPNRSRPLIF